MNKIRLKYIAGFVIGALLFGCNDSESDLLETKVYFEENSVTIKASGDDVITMIAGETFFQKFLADRGNL